jgi:flagellar basal-body rod protein FlgF
MADGIYVTMCGAAARTAQLDAIADNLANAQTPGFKSSRPSFESFLPAGGAADKSYPAAVATNFDLRTGTVTRTDNPLDVVPEDGAFLAVGLPGGRIGYTRDGRLSLDADRILTQAGRPVLGTDGHPIRFPLGSRPQIQDDGTVRAIQDDGTGHTREITVGELALFRVAGPVDRVGPATLAPGTGGRAAHVTAKIQTGRVELGNSSPLDGMVQLISAQRSFDASMQALQTYRTMDGRSSDIGRVK